MKGLCIGGYFDGTEQDFAGSATGIHIVRVPSGPNGSITTEAYRGELLCCPPDMEPLSFWILTSLANAGAFRELMICYQAKKLEDSAKKPQE